MLERDLDQELEAGLASTSHWVTSSKALRPRFHDSLHTEQRAWELRAGQPLLGCSQRQSGVRERVPQSSSAGLPVMSGDAVPLPLSAAVDPESRCLGGRWPGQLPEESALPQLWQCAGGWAAARRAILTPLTGRSTHPALLCRKVRHLPC